jgi:hypothetical protein
MAMVRKVTNELLDLIGEGVLDADTVVMACLKYMSEDEVADMAHINGLLEDIEDEEDEV